MPPPEAAVDLPEELPQGPQGPVEAQRRPVLADLRDLEADGHQRHTDDGQVLQDHLQVEPVASCSETLGRQIPREKFNFWWVKWKLPPNTRLKG